MNEHTQIAGDLPAPLVAALQRVLRPLIRLLLSYGFRYQTFIELVKSTYIHVAEEEFKLDKKAQTDSRISLLTGVHRRDVNRLRKESSTESSLPLQASMSAQLLAIWSGNEQYIDSQGIPLPLPRLASKGGDHSFEALVRSVSKDFRPRVVLDEWLRQGIATLDKQDNVCLTADAFASPQGIEEKSFYFGQNIHDHLAATVHNLSDGGFSFDFYRTAPGISPYHGAHCSHYHSGRHTDVVCHYAPPDSLAWVVVASLISADN